MEFLNFSLLWFLPLASVPILLHLLTLHRLRTVELSTFRYLFDSYVQQRRRMRLMEWLIAALRTLFLLFLIFAISRPLMSEHWSALFGSGSGGSGREVVMLVDCSASMNAATGGERAIVRAKNAALSVAERLHADERLTLIRVGSKPVEIFSRFSSDAQTIRDQILALEVSPSRGNLFAAFSHLFGPETEARPNQVIYLFTDRQSSGWRELRDAEADGLVPEKTELIVAGVGSNQEVSNRAVIGEIPRDHRAIVGLPITLRPKVANYSSTETEEVPVSIFVDDKEIARKVLTIKPNDTEEAEIVFTPNRTGVLQGRFEIPPDDFTDDDSFLFTLSAQPPAGVLLVNGHPADDPFENEGLYLNAALTTSSDEYGTTVAALNADPASESGESASATDAEKEFVRSLNVLEIPEDKLNSPALRDARVVILADCGRLTEAHVSMLREFVAAGGGLIIFPGERAGAKLDLYNRQFFEGAQASDVWLTSARLGAIEGDPEDSATFERFAALDFAHPVLSVFDDSESRYLTQVNFYRRFSLLMPEERGNTWALAEFSSGTPAIVETRFGDGHVLLAAFPATAKWSNLPLKPEFVPLLLRMVDHVKRRSELEGPSAVPAEGEAEFVVDGSWGTPTGKVLDVTGRVTPITFQRSASRRAGVFDQTAEKGYYTVQVRGGTAEQPKQGTTAFAVNLDAGESDFKRIEDEAIESLLPGVELTLVDASGEAQQAYGSVGGTQSEVWRFSILGVPFSIVVYRWLIYFLFLVIGVEFLLATFAGQPAGDQKPPSLRERIRDLSPGQWVGRLTGAGSE